MNTILYNEYKKIATAIGNNIIKRDEAYDILNGYGRTLAFLMSWKRKGNIRFEDYNIKDSCVPFGSIMKAISKKMPDSYIDELASNFIVSYRFTEYIDLEYIMFVEGILMSRSEYSLDDVSDMLISMIPPNVMDYCDEWNKRGYRISAMSSYNIIELLQTYQRSHQCSSRIIEEFSEFIQELNDNSLYELICHASVDGIIDILLHCNKKAQVKILNTISVTTFCDVEGRCDYLKHPFLNLVEGEKECIRFLRLYKQDISKKKYAHLNVDIDKLIQNFEEI